MRPILALFVLLFATPALAQEGESPDDLESPFAGDEAPDEGEIFVVDEDAADPPADVPAAPPASYGGAAQVPAPPNDGYAQPAQPGQPAYPQPAQGYGQPGYAQPGADPPTYHREPYVEGVPLPPGARIVEQTRKGMLIPGISLLAGGYVITVLTWSIINAFDEDTSEGMLVPFIGPFFLFPDAETEGRLLLTLLGLAQTGGFALMLAGILAKQKAVVWYGDSGVELRPMATAGGGGVHLTYDF